MPFDIFETAKPDTTLSIEDREIGGLGILLVNELMDEVAYKRRNNTNVVRLIMNFEERVMEISVREVSGVNIVALSRESRHLIRPRQRKMRSII